MKKTTSGLVIITGLLITGTIFWLFFRPAPILTGTDEPALVPTAPAAEIRIVAFGDSLTAGYNLPIDEAYPAILERALALRGWSVEVINSGVSGETSAGGVRRAEFIRSLNPDIVLFGLGGNDALRLLPPTELEKNLSEALLILRSGDDPPRVLLIGMRAPANADETYRTAFDSVYPKLSKVFSLPLVPFFLEGVALDPRYTLPDGIHPNSVGYEIIVNRILLPPLLEILPEL
ncbi:MAG: arylesterase [Candidatus Moraniibacteriota bacterium]